MEEQIDNLKAIPPLPSSRGLRKDSITSALLHSSAAGGEKSPGINTEPGEGSLASIELGQRSSTELRRSTLYECRYLRRFNRSMKSKTGAERNILFIGERAQESHCLFVFWACEETFASFAVIDLPKLSE